MGHEVYNKKRYLFLCVRSIRIRIRRRHTNTQSACVAAHFKGINFLFENDVIRLTLYIIFFSTPVL